MTFGHLASAAILFAKFYAGTRKSVVVGQKLKLVVVVYYSRTLHLNTLMEKLNTTLQSAIMSIYR